MRKPRTFLGFVGMVLFICMFLPAVKGCHDEAIYPIELPPVIPPYLYGLGFAIAAYAPTKGVFIYLRILTILFLIECVIAVGGAPPFGLVVILAPATILGVLGFKSYAPKRLAGAAIVTGIASAIWFGLFSFHSDSLFGIHLSLAAAVALVIAGVMWIAEPDPPIEPELPTATVISSGQ